MTEPQPSQSYEPTTRQEPRISFEDLLIRQIRRLKAERDAGMGPGFFRALSRLFAMVDGR